MRQPLSSSLAASGVLLLMLPLAACSIDVQKHDSGRRADVDIRTPAGGLAVHTGGSAEGTGLPVYPGARPAHHGNRDESADVDISAGWFGVKVVAAKFESDDEPEQVLGFYRGEMATYGPVVECRGNVRFRWRDGTKRPECRERQWSREFKLVTGTEDRQRIVSVKPRGGGSEFAVVYVATGR